MTYKTNSSDVFANLEFRIHEFFNKQTETIRNLVPFSTAKTEKNWWEKLVKASDEFVVI